MHLASHILTWQAALPCGKPRSHLASRLLLVSFLREKVPISTGTCSDFKLPSLPSFVSVRLVCAVCFLPLFVFLLCAWVVAVTVPFHTSPNRHVNLGNQQETAAIQKVTVCSI